VKKGHRPPR
jgi:putative transposase